MLYKNFTGKMTGKVGNQWIDHWFNKFDISIFFQIQISGVAKTENTYIVSVS